MVYKSFSLKNILEVLCARRGLGVSDSRDMIYTHISLVNHLGIEVDYDQTTGDILRASVELS